MTLRGYRSHYCTTVFLPVLFTTCLWQHNELKLDYKVTATLFIYLFIYLFISYSRLYHKKTENSNRYIRHFGIFKSLYTCVFDESITYGMPSKFKFSLVSSKKKTNIKTN